MPPFRPNWCTSVMGTAIVAVVAAALTVRVPGAEDLAVAAWLLAAVGLGGAAALAVPALRDGGLRRFADDPHTAPFLGAPPMAALTVAAATVVAGDAVLGLHAALVAAWMLWVPATVAGCVVAIALPLRAADRPALRVDPGHPTWILAAVPPLTSATTGAVFLAHLPAGGVRDGFLVLLGLLLALGVGGAAAAIRLVLVRMGRVGLGPLRSVPTLWIVLGPLGQLVAALLLLSAGTGLAGTALTAVAVGVWCVALAWLLFVLAVTGWAWRRGLPFSLAFWSFTFPVGTTALGTAELAATTGEAGIGWLAAALLGLLLAGWLVAAGGTVRAAVRRQRTAPVPAPA